MSTGQPAARQPRRSPPAPVWQQRRGSGNLRWAELGRASEPFTHSKLREGRRVHKARGRKGYYYSSCACCLCITATTTRRAASGPAGRLTLAQYGILCKQNDKPERIMATRPIRLRVSEPPEIPFRAPSSGRPIAVAMGRDFPSLRPECSPAYVRRRQRPPRQTDSSRGTGQTGLGLAHDIG